MHSKQHSREMEASASPVLISAIQRNMQPSYKSAAKQRSRVRFAGSPRNCRVRDFVALALRRGLAILAAPSMQLSPRHVVCSAPRHGRNWGQSNGDWLCGARLDALRRKSVPNCVAPVGIDGCNVIIVGRKKMLTPHP